MNEIKDTLRALVRIGYDGRVHKIFRGHQAKERYENEIRVLKLLEKRGCTYVPRLLESNDGELKIITTNCGRRVESMSDERLKSLFEELKVRYGVIHDDPFLRNVTYDARRGFFCIIDFELATVLDDPNAEKGRLGDKESGSQSNWA